MLRAVDLSKRFDGVYALDKLNLEVAAGDIHCLLGANGAGKTTTISLFLGFLEPTTGAAYVDGREVAANKQAIRRLVAYVPEQVNLYPLLTGLENLAYFAALAGDARAETRALRALFDDVGLAREAADLRVEHYSKGMRQKVGLAVALAKNARAILLDEPLSGLDPKAASEFCLLLRRLASRGAAVLMVTHDLFRARELATRIGIMKGGRLVEDLVASDVTHAELERIYLDRMVGAQSAGVRA